MRYAFCWKEFKEGSKEVLIFWSKLLLTFFLGMALFHGLFRDAYLDMSKHILILLSSLSSSTIHELGWKRSVGIDLILFFFNGFLWILAFFGPVSFFYVFPPVFKKMYQYAKAKKLKTKVVFEADQKHLNFATQKNNTGD